MKPAASPPLKPCAPLITGLFVLAILLYYPTRGYGSIACLILAAIVMGGQIFLLAQHRRDLTALRILHENKLLTADGKHRLQDARACVAAETRRRQTQADEIAASRDYCG